jgi:hypothetical protein
MGSKTFDEGTVPRVPVKVCDVGGARATGRSAETTPIAPCITAVSYRTLSVGHFDVEVRGATP